MKFWLLPILKVLSGILFLLTLVSGYGGHFNPAYWTLPAIGILFFPYLAMATLILSAIWLILRQWITGCIGIGVLLACGPTFLEAMPFKFAREAENPSNTFSMITYNCLHLDDSQFPDLPYNRSLSFLINSGVDFICLQECYGLSHKDVDIKYEDQVDSLRKIYPYHSREGIREEVMFSKYPLEELKVNLGDSIKYGNIIACRMNIDGHSLTVIDVHLPSYLLSQEERQVITEVKTKDGMKKSIKELEGSVYEKMKKAFQERARISKAVAEFAASQEGNVIVCGDFNDVPGSWTYRNFTSVGFQDAYAQTGFGHIITYNQHLMLFHIDQILYKGQLEPLKVRKEKLKTSDHYPLIAEFEFI